MNNVISITEIRIKMAIKEATNALIKARTLMSQGEHVPEGLIPRLQDMIAELEKQLSQLIEG
jgi:hypothetical protein